MQGKVTTNIQHSLRKMDLQTSHFCLLTFKYIFLHFQIIPPPPPICPDSLEDADALGSMLISWYMSGYHTGYYMVSDHSASFPDSHFVVM